LTWKNYKRNSGKVQLADDFAVKQAQIRSKDMVNASEPCPAAAARVSIDQWKWLPN
jgi:hypothetical protein